MRITHLSSVFVTLSLAGLASTAHAQPASEYRSGVEFGLGRDNSVSGNIKSSGVGRTNDQAQTVTLHAQPAIEYRWSVEFGLGFDNSMSGNINSSGVGNINNQAVVITKNQYQMCMAPVSTCASAAATCSTRSPRCGRRSRC